MSRLMGIVCFSVCFSTLMSGCSLSSYVINKTDADKKAHEVEQTFLRKDGCQTETADMRPDANTRSYYRCTGGNCKSHGCSPN
jgi:hypothetical protein